MNTSTDMALHLVRQALSRYTDTPAEHIQLDSVLADIQVDSLTLAELLFELEDRLGTSISETAEVPKRVSDVVALVLPYLGEEQLMKVA